MIGGAKPMTGLPTGADPLQTIISLMKNFPTKIVHKDDII